MSANRRRWFRPHTLDASAGSVWVVDAFQPVALRLDPRGEVRDLVGWPDVPPPADRRRIAAGDDHLWIQEGDVVVGIDERGTRTTAAADGMALVGAGGGGAWLAGVAPPSQRIAVVTPDGVRRDIALDLPLRAVNVDERGLQLLVLPGVPVGPDRRGRYHGRTVDVSWTELDADRVAVAGRPAVGFAWPDPGPSWARPGAAGWASFGARWDGDGYVSGVEVRRLMMRTRRSPYEAERAQVRGWVRAGLTAHDRLWFVSDFRGPWPPRWTDPRAVEVVAVEPGGRPRTVLAAESLDVSGSCWPVPAVAPRSADEHVEHWMRRLAPVGGRARPLREGVSDLRVELVEQWPRTAIVLTFRYPAHPGGRLRHHLQLFDEVGRPCEVADSLMAMEETLAGLAWSTRSGRAPADGVLDV